MNMILIKIIKFVFEVTGFSIVRNSHLPSYNLLGLKKLNINTIIDIGANRGQFLMEYVKYFPRARFYCFEPLENECLHLKELIKNYNNDITIINSALGNEDGTKKMYKHEYSPSSSILDTTDKCLEYYPQIKNQSKIEIPITTLDRYTSRVNVGENNEILLKIDVQGYELEVLKGAEKTLKMITACLLEINFEPLYKDQPSFKEIYTLLNNAGFEYAGAMDQNFNDDGKLVFSDILFIRKKHLK